MTSKSPHVHRAPNKVRCFVWRAPPTHLANRPHISQVVSLEQLPAAHAEAERRRTRGKVVVQVKAE